MLLPCNRYGNIGAATVEAASGIIVGNKTYTSNLATALSIKPAGVLSAPWDACTQRWRIPAMTETCWVIH